MEAFRLCILNSRCMQFHETFLGREKECAESSQEQQHATGPCSETGGGGEILIVCIISVNIHYRISPNNERAISSLSICISIKVNSFQLTVRHYLILVWASQICHLFNKTFVFSSSPKTKIGNIQSVNITTLKVK